MTRSISGVLPTDAGNLHWFAMGGEPPPFPTNEMAPVWLNASEAVFWQQLKTPKRRRDWAVGRWAAKNLVSALVRERTGQTVASDQIIILPHADGWPIVVIPSLEDIAPPLSLSISHSHERAFCAVMEGQERPIGADIEFVEGRSSSFEEEYFTPLERQFLDAVPDTQRNAITNAIWSGKEACLKAIRRGLAENTCLVSCLPHPQTTGYPEWLPMRVIWSNTQNGRQLPPLMGRWRVSDGFVLTLVYPA